uniref:C-CAP/cofactor C-like domain-containing protein n=1 Tax=Calcidiscus leptoporus TaxID=127549 RepID=A0A7S0JB84_9EUKA
MDAVFAALNQGEGVTSGLKHVKKGEGLKDRPVVAPKAKPAAAAAQPKAAAPAKPPKFALEDKKWVVDYQVKNSALEIVDAQPKHTVYAYQCTDSILQVKSKVTLITLDSCKKVSLVFESSITGVALVNCTSCKVQVTGSAQTFTIDKCSGTQLILNKESLSAEVVSAKSSELNIIVPGATENDDYTEHPIPEQFVSKYVNGKWVTECMSHTG